MVKSGSRQELETTKVEPYLTGVDMKIEHKSGKQNCYVDTLSRA